MKKKSLFWILGCLLIAGTAAGYTHFYGEKAKAVQYRTAKVERGSLSSQVTATGTVNPVITVLVGSQVSGTIQNLYVDYNSPVKKGQLIALLDDDEYLQQVNQAQAELALNDSAVILPH